MALPTYNNPNSTQYVSAQFPQISPTPLENSKEPSNVSDSNDIKGTPTSFQVIQNPGLPPARRSEILFGAPMHSGVVGALKASLQDPKKYAQYTKNLSHDLHFLEPIVKNHLGALSMECLPKTARSENIDQDNKNLDSQKGAEDLSVQKIVEGHETYFSSIEKNPTKAIAHLSVHYIGFLFGGQKIGGKITADWGEGFANLYKFEDGTKETYQKQLAAYLEKLSEPEFQIFKQELAQAWTFTGHLLGV